VAGSTHLGLAGDQDVDGKVTFLNVDVNNDLTVAGNIVTTGTASFNFAGTSIQTMGQISAGSTIYANAGTGPAINVTTTGNPPFGTQVLTARKALQGIGDLSADYTTEGQWKLNYIVGTGVWEVFHNVGSGLTVIGTLTAGDVVDLAPLAADATDFDPAAVSAAFDTMRAVSYSKAMPQGMAEDGTTPIDAAPVPRAGVLLDAATVGALSGVATTTADGDGWSVPGVIALLVAEMKSVRQRVAQLEGAV